MKTTGKYFTLVWQEMALEKCAEALFVMNPRWETVEDVREFIIAHANLYVDGETYVGTGGMYIVAYRPDWAEAGEMHCLPVIASYLAADFAKAKTATVN